MGGFGTRPYENLHKTGPVDPEQLNNKRQAMRALHGALKRAWQAKYGVNNAKAQAFEAADGTLRARTPGNGDQ